LKHFLSFFIRKGNKLYSRIYIFLTLSIFIAILAISTILYFNFEKIALNIVYTNTINNLQQTSKDAGIMAETGSKLVNQLYRDLTIAKLLYYESPDVYELQPAMTQLGSYSQVMQFIDSIYVYNSQTNKIYISSALDLYLNRIQDKEGFEDKEVLKIIDNYKDYKPFSPIPRKLTIEASENSAMNCYTFLGYNWLDTGDTLKRAVIVNISEEWLNNILNPENSKGSLSGETFILDTNGKVISNSEHFSMMTDLSETTYARTILNSSSDGYFIQSVNGIKSFIAYTAPDSLGWRYIRIISHASITKDINAMKAKTMVIAFLILLFGFLLSSVASRKLYKPIEKISLDLDALEEEKRNTTFTLKQEFLRKLILENLEMGSEEMQSMFVKYRVCIGTEGFYRIVVLKIDYYTDFTTANSPDDRNILKFAIMNIASEICSREFSAEAVDMNDNQVVLILNSKDSEALNEQDVAELVKAVQAVVLEHLNISLTATISRARNPINVLNRLYNQSAEASLHRLFYGHGSIISADTIMSFDTKEYVYPEDMEKAMQDALLKGRIEEAKQLYLNIINGCAEYPFTVINLVMCRLVFAVKTVLNTLQKNYNIVSYTLKNLLFIHLYNTETIEEINKRFFTVIDDVTSCINEKRNSKQLTIVNKINEIINNEYRSSSLSLDSISDALGMSATYVGRLYKQNTLKTILEAITEVRMDNARKLLLETDYPIAKIAELSGFSEDSYFYKTFKKENGITPTDYRKNNPMGSN